MWKDHNLVVGEIEWLKRKLHAESEARGGRSTADWLKDVLTLRNIKDLGIIMILAMVQTGDCLYTYVIVMAKMARFEMNEYFAGIILQASIVIGYFIAPYFIEKLRYWYIVFVFICWQFSFHLTYLT